MNAHTTTITAAVMADSIARHSGTNAFLADFHAAAMQIGADIRAGRKVMTENGVFTPADLAAAVHTEGGVFYPTLSCGLDADVAFNGIASGQIGALECGELKGGNDVDRSSARASILIGEAGLSEERTGCASSYTVSPYSCDVA